MNGAMADPLARITRPPNRPVSATMGISQYFLRASKNSKSARANDMGSSVLLRHRAWRRGRVGTRDPIALGVGVETRRDRTLAEEPHQQADRHDGAEIDQSHEQRTDDAMQQQAEAKPKMVQRREQRRREPGGSEEG